MKAKEKALSVNGKNIEIITENNNKITVVRSINQVKEIHYYTDKDSVDSDGTIILNDEESKIVAAILNGIITFSV
ncbi:hypothetical protein ABEW32_20550 [Paenibacillus jamilae]|uniref:hypothetical protein n=1 Tax=Paenibacillus jamilae TaxID=114136 RepID=UPI003D2A065D